VILRLRPTMVSDLDFVLSVEAHPANRPHITPWERTQHEGAVRFPDFRHFIVEAAVARPTPASTDPATATEAVTDPPAPDEAPPAASGDDRVGFVILQGCRNRHASVELKRLVLALHGRGLGRRCVRLLKRMAFDDLGAHRFWLDVQAHNVRAVALYASEGFVEEGRLRESVRLSGPGAAGWDSLVVMSVLEAEYRQRLAQGLEPGA
jgi:diamine N-acetyltransferase